MEANQGGPVLLFLPARNEEGSVASVIRRVPEKAAGRPVLCLVIDDGSTDSTAREAVAAGAKVISMPGPCGLGAAVRAGLREGSAAGAAVVAFCDADGEYAPEELERLAGPILSGEADYVAGNRFAEGTPAGMLRRRGFGNRVLTRGLSVLAGRAIGDGQSGYRALSASAAARAEIIHDFNYAQVLTLDLLQKGFRYLEVPISYSFRTTGRSFVRLGPYLLAVLPAVWKQLRQSSTTWPAKRSRAAAQYSRSMAPPEIASTADQAIERA